MPRHGGHSIGVGFSLAVTLVAPVVLDAWSNGQPGNAGTDANVECANPPYATHDWIADHALALLPTGESAWLMPHKALYLLGTEAPDHRGIPTSCGAPNRGYDDRSSGHSIEWNAGATQMLQRPRGRTGARGIQQGRHRLW